MKTAYMLGILLLFCGCEDDSLHLQQRTTGTGFVREIHYRLITFETDDRQIELIEFCHPELVWQGMRARIQMSRKVRTNPNGSETGDFGKTCWETSVEHLPPDVGK